MARITGAHSVIFSAHPDADREFFRDVLKAPHVDVGGGWLIFGLPPAELAVHPSDEGARHELYLMCDDVEAFVAEMRMKNVECGPVTDQRWGRLTELTLPGGGTLGVYEPRHPRPRAMGGPAPKAEKRATKRSLKTPAKRSATRTRSKKSNGARPARGKRRG